MELKLFDAPTASALAQILPIILLALMVEMRRTEIHRRGRSPRWTRVLLGCFFGLFAVIETALVLSIDGHLFPTRLSDLIVAIIIFGMLWLLFFLSMASGRGGEKSARQKQRRQKEPHS